MKCPLCDNAIMNSKTLEENLNVKTCNKCGGYWISSSEYFKWLSKHANVKTNNPFNEISLHVENSTKAKLCPDCGHILIKYKVGHGIDFRLDCCNSCNGVWLDKNEWEILKGRNFHEEINRIFTTEWQNEVKTEELKSSMEKIELDKFGTKDYKKIKDIKDWIDKHPKKSFILAFLNEQ